MAPGWKAVSRINGDYHIRIVVRDGQGRTNDDYHATVARRSDGVELIWISDYLWVLNFRLRTRAIQRAFRQYDKRQKKLAQVREFEI